MFSVIDTSGLQSHYVEGVVRDRRVQKVSQIATMKKIGGEKTPSEQHYEKESSNFPTRLYKQVETYSRATSTTLFARDIMSSPVTSLPINTELTKAWELLKTTRFRHIPIHSSENELIGILSDRDLFRGTVESALPGIKGSTVLDKITIEAYVSHPVLVAAPQTSLLAIARVLLEERIGAIPVVSPEKAVQGIITRSDILRVIVSHPNFEQWG